MPAPCRRREGREDVSTGHWGAESTPIGGEGTGEGSGEESSPAPLRQAGLALSLIRSRRNQSPAAGLLCWSTPGCRGE